MCRGASAPGSTASTTKLSFDTLRLKENNVRIGILDTSTGAFANDWELTFNDTASGAANYFALTDVTAGRQLFRVDAGAPADALHVDGNGDVGLGIADALLDMHIKRGDTPAIRLEQDNCDGFTPQTWDVGGNEANFFVRDQTAASLRSASARARRRAASTSARPATWRRHRHRRPGSARVGQRRHDRGAGPGGQRDRRGTRARRAAQQRRGASCSSRTPSARTGRSAAQTASPCAPTARRCRVCWSATTARSRAGGRSRSTPTRRPTQNEQPAGGAALLAALRTLPIARREYAGDATIRPPVAGVLGSSSTNSILRGYA